ncbi:MAG: hypothetical protein JNK74_01230 [Candidatus Hydrogenedentes bacterium]|nr:hypothetical protein [Candidatus Hydrogenedentota bacterium]
MRVRRRATALALLFLAAILGVSVDAAEQWECRFLLSDRGVQFPEVREFVEDRQGRIWAASWGGGVARIEGSSWTSYREAEGLASDWVRGLALGEDGTIWVSTPGGLCYFQGEALHCIHRSALPPLQGDEPDLIHMDGTGALLISTYEGALLRVPGASAKASVLWENTAGWEVLLARSDSGASRTADFEEDGSGRVVVTFKDDTWAVINGNVLERTPGPGGTMYITREGGDTAGARIWACSSTDEATSGLYLMEGRGLVRKHVMPEVVRGLVTGPDGWCYAATTSGLYRFNETSLAKVDLGHQVGSPEINEAFFAADNGLWLGAREGLVRGAPHAWKHYPVTVQNHGLGALLQDAAAPEGLLAVDEHACLARLEDDGWHETTQLAAPEPLDGYATFGDKPDVWAMGDTMLYQFTRDSGALIGAFPMPRTGEDRKLFMTSSGELWLAAVDGVHALVQGRWEKRPVAPGYERRTVSAFHEASPGVIYVGVRDGIERWQGEEISYFGASAGVSEDDAVYTICQSRNGDLWFGSYGSGVYRYDGTTFERFDDTRGLSHHSVSNILETSDGTLWLSYRRVGLASYREKRWLNFGFANGLTNSAITHMIEGAGGSLWLVTAREGFYQYRPDSEAPETALTAATASVPYGGVGVFSFRAIDAWQRTPPHVLLYSWRVIDDAGATELSPWNEFSPETSYIAEHLKPGTYRFEVRASDDARNVDPTPASVAFTVANPLWSEPRVYLPVGFMVMLVAAAFVLRIRSHHALLNSEAALYASNQQLMSEIRERLQAEQRLNDHFEQLEELVRGRTEELEIAQRALVEQERLATLGKVTASVSHELRNPLGTLRGTLFMIGRKVQGLDLGLEDALARGERSIQRCDRIIEEFLDFTRTVAMEIECVSMDPWLAGVLQEMVIPLEIHCDYTFESGLELEIDPERLRRAVINVVNNAVQAMEDHNGEYKRLRVKSRQRDGRFEIVVKDNGPGMSEESLSRIFEPLYSTKGFGVGLGVPIVKGIMVKHHGGVEYHSVPGKGTTVVLWLPV